MWIAATGSTSRTSATTGFRCSNILENPWLYRGCRQQFPEQARDEVTGQVARLMARASVAQIRALRADNDNPEVSDDSNDR